jgi:hypothetical protein
MSFSNYKSRRRDAHLRKKKPRTGEKEKLWKKQGKNRESEPAGERERETNTDEKKSKKKRLRERRLVTEKKQ